MSFNVSRFMYYPFMKTSLKELKFPMFVKDKFKKSYDNLPYDPYIHNQTRQRRYGNYRLINLDHQKFSIYHTENNKFKQNVSDSRGEERIFELIEDPYHLFIHNFLTMAAQLTNKNHPIQELSIDLHQVRQIVYPGINSHNSEEGIHQDGANYIISACVLNRFNVSGGYSSVYDNHKNHIYSALLQEDELIFQDDKMLYHYVTPITYLGRDSIDPIGYRDLIGCDITIIS